MSLMKGKNVGCLFLLFMASIVMAEVKVKDVVVKPRWPWNGLVDVTYTVVCDEKDEENKPKEVFVVFTAIDGDRNQTIPMMSLTGDGAKNLVTGDGGGKTYTVTWNAAKDAPTLNSSELKVCIHAIAGRQYYMVVDLSGGPDASSYPVRYTNTAPNLNDDTCRTTELWLRMIPAGTFMMGSPENEVGRDYDDMAQHQVTLTQMFYIGVFECTLKQWELVMGYTPYGNSGSCYPVNYIYDSEIRGYDEQSICWPKYGYTVHETSFMGKLRKKTGLTFDLPTEAQWEYACRAGTTTALNSGKNLTNPSGQDAAMDEVGWYNHVHSSGIKVGLYLPNAWGLYDMHGNVGEMCLDYYTSNQDYLTSTEAETDPVGPERKSFYRVAKGGAMYTSAGNCRSASRWNDSIGYRSDETGFRIICLPLVR